MRCLRFAVLIFFCSLTTTHAFDYFGAELSNSELPSSYMKLGIIGSYVHVDKLLHHSPAERQGFQQGDYLIAVNGTDIQKVADLLSVTTEELRITVLRGYKRKTIRFNLLMAKQETAPPATTVSSRPIVQAQPEPQHVKRTDNAPALRFDDAALEKKYGRTTPEQRQAMRQADMQRLQQEQAAYEALKRQTALEDQQRKAAEEARKKKEEEDNKRTEELRIAEARRQEAEARRQEAEARRREWEQEWYRRSNILPPPY